MPGMIQVKITKLVHGLDLPLPAYASEQAAGADLMAAVDNDIILVPSARRLIPAGIALALPEGFEAQIRPRSGLALKNGVTLLNSPGTIDSDYRGEIKILLINLGHENFIITRGMRIAQLVIAPVAKAQWRQVEMLDDTPRSVNGFGSTGMKAVGK